MLIGICSVKGAPGVTTAALALAARWPFGDPLVIEADPAGGDISARHQLPPMPGLVSLAAAARRHSTVELLADHSQSLPGGLQVVCGPIGVEQARAALGVLASRGLHALRRAASVPDSVVLVDVGRLDAFSPALPLVQVADALVVLSRPRADELSHVATFLGEVSAWNKAPCLVLVGSGYSRTEIECELRVPVMGTLPHDISSASFLCGQGNGRPLDRSKLGQAAASLATTLVEHIHAEIDNRDAEVVP
jgi:hypothetical protein